jgi:hypothetical protein
LEPFAFSLLIEVLQRAAQTLFNTSTAQVGDSQSSEFDALLRIGKLRVRGE